MDTKKIETVLTTVTIDSKVDSGKIDVVVGESAKMDVVKAVNYIQSGKAEIEAGVTEVLSQVDNHVAEKTAEFDQNASDKTDAFNSNAVEKTGDFNTNASDKTSDFNDNYAEKKALIDAEVAVAEGYSAEAKQWAIGEPTEPSEGSAKYWAEQASRTLPNDGQLDIQVNGSSIATFTANQATNTTANIVVPDSATWGNITGTLSNQTDLNNALNSKQDVIEDLADIRDNATTGAGLAPQVEVNTQRIEDLTVAKFPNVVIVGTPHIEGGQVSNYSDTNYLQFPFVDISRGQPFDIYFSFTTNQDITTQQNILDAYFGIALAIQNGKGVMALSSNGTSWDIGTTTGTNILLPNTTYYVKYSWTGTQYNASLSTDDQEYVPDMIINSTLSPYKTTIFIGGSPNIFGAGSSHPFKGTINFNKSKVVVNGITVWEGMADVGLASRANVSLNNLDEVGEARFDAKQDTLIAGENITIVNNVISSAGGAVDNKSITKNTDNQIQAVGVIEKNTGAVKYDWIGTLAEYNAQNVETLHPDWVCYITDDVSGGTSVYTKTEVDNAISTALTAMLDNAFPVGYLCISKTPTCPLASLIPNSTWTLVASDMVLQGSGTYTAGTSVSAGLPEIGGKFGLFATYGGGSASGGFTQTFAGSTGSPNTVSKAGDMEVSFSASRSNPIYGNSTTVQPPAYVVNIWERIA